MHTRLSLRDTTLSPFYRTYVLLNLLGVSLALLLVSILVTHVSWGNSRHIGVESAGRTGPALGRLMVRNDTQSHGADDMRQDASLLDFVSRFGDLIMFSEGVEERNVLFQALQAYRESNRDVHFPAVKDALEEALGIVRMAMQLHEKSSEYVELWSECRNRMLFLSSTLRSQNTQLDASGLSALGDIGHGISLFILIPTIAVLFCVAILNCMMWRKLVVDRKRQTSMMEVPTSTASQFSPLTESSLGKVAEGDGLKRVLAHVASVFPVTPVASVGSVASVVSDNSDGSHPLYNIPILLVEDSPLIAEACMRLLRKAGSRVTHAESGEKALELASAGDHALVLVDLSMPGMDGYETVRRLRSLSARYASVPVMALTASDVEQVAGKCFQAGMHCVLSKPLCVADIVKGLTGDCFDHKCEMGKNRMGLAGKDRNLKLSPRKNDEGLLNTSSVAGANALVVPLQILDIPAALARLEISNVEYNQLLGAFLESIHSYVLRLREAHAGQQLGRVEELAHRIKGESANIGAVVVYDTATVLGKALHGGQAQAIERAYLNFMQALVELSELDLEGSCANRESK